MTPETQQKKVLRRPDARWMTLRESGKAATGRSCIGPTGATRADGFKKGVPDGNRHINVGVNVLVLGAARRLHPLMAMRYDRTTSIPEAGTRNPSRAAARTHKEAV